jgi:hypothetical protein
LHLPTGASVRKSVAGQEQYINFTIVIYKLPKTAFMKNIAWLLLAFILLAACKKQKAEEVVTPTEFCDVIPPKILDVPNWHEEYLVATRYSADSVPIGVDSMLAYVHEGHVFLNYEGRPYRVSAFQYGETTAENVPAYDIQVTTLDGAVMAFGVAQPGKYQHNGRWLTARQTISLAPGERPPFNKLVSAYLGK